MRKTLALLLFLSCTAPCSAAEWTILSKTLDDPDVRFVAADPAEPQKLFAATTKAVYATTDAGERWKRVLSLGSGSSRLRFVRTAANGVVYAGSDRGLHRSIDGGRRWSYLFRPSGDKPNAPLDVAEDSRDPSLLWLATESGLFRLDTRHDKAQRIAAFGGAAVYSILARDAVLFAASADGIHKSIDSGKTWRPVYAALAAEPTQASASLEQFNVEEIMRPSFMPFSSLAYIAGEDAIFAASKNGLLRGDPAKDAWSVLEGQNLESGRVNGLAPSARALYVATDRGVYRWDRSAFKEISDGLTSREVRAVSYHARGDYLLAATAQGIYKMSHPELTFEVLPKEMPAADPREVLRRFDGEPTIAEIQRAAIRYAEVHPEKIERWRKAAARRALLPTLSLGADLSQDRNVDVDRGGTGDPDRFIMGPEERSLDWSIGVSWNLGELIWNDDQTSIDARSRLMVELRDDILNDVTHLYYERRRLEVEMALSQNSDLTVRLERELKLQELTARIDALTGGHLSHSLESGGERR